jgi:hypothetical protein
LHGIDTGDGAVGEPFERLMLELEARHRPSDFLPRVYVGGRFRWSGLESSPFRIEVGGAAPDQIAERLDRIVLLRRPVVPPDVGHVESGAERRCQNGVDIGPRGEHFLPVVRHDPDLIVVAP